MPVTVPSNARNDTDNDRSDGHRVRARANRIIDVRETNMLEDIRTDQCVVLDQFYAEADLPGAEQAEWGPVLPVAGYDTIHLMLDYEQGSADHTVVYVAMQASPIKNPESPLWFDVYADGGGGDLSRKLFVAEVSAGDVKILWAECIRRGYFMRFKIWGNGSTVTGSRGVLRGIREMAGH